MKIKMTLIQLAMVSMGVLLAAKALAQGTIPGVVAQSVDLGSLAQLGAGAVATWLANQALKSRSKFLSKFLALLSPVVGAGIMGAYAGAAGGITGSGHIGADIGHGAMTGLIGGALAVWGHEGIGQHVQAGLAGPPQP